MERLEVDITFSPGYYTQRFGLRYQEDYFDNPIVRCETDRRARRGLFELFGDLGLGQENPQPVVRLGWDDTLNITLMFGGELQVTSGITWVTPGFLDLAEVDSLCVPDIATTWPHTRFQEHYEQAATNSDWTILPPKPHGILESAVEMCGEGFLSDLLTNPARAQRLLDILTETVIVMKTFWDEKVFGSVRPGLSLGACSTTMLSAEVVARFLVPRYSKIASRFGDAFICSCGPSTQNLENFAQVEGARYVRLGWGTDLGKAARILQGLHLKPSLDVARTAHVTPDELKGDVTYVLNALTHIDEVSLLLINASQEMPDENVRCLVETAREYARRNGVMVSVPCADEKGRPVLPWCY